MMLQILFHLLSCADGTYSIFEVGYLLLFICHHIMQFINSCINNILLLFISLEVIWKLRSGKKKGVSKEERIKYLLPKAMKEKLDAVGGSPYPYLRLILPEHDSVRPHTGFKESRAADTWAKALGCNKGHNIHSLLTGYRNAKLIGSDPITKANSQNSISDLSSVLMDVMQHRAPGTGSKLTVREINEWLDVLVSVVNDTFDVPTEKPTEKSKWIKALEKVVRSGQGKKKKGDIYADLVEQLLHKNLSVSAEIYLCVIIKHD